MVINVDYVKLTMSIMLMMLIMLKVVGDMSTKLCFYMMQIQHPWPQLLNFEPTRIPASRLPLLSTTPKQEGSVKVKRHCTAVLTFSLCKSSCKCSWIRSELRPRTFKASLTSFSSFLRHVCERLENVHFCLFMRLAYKRILASDGLDIPDFLFWRQQLARVT